MEEERSDRKGEILTQPHHISAANTLIPSTLPSNLVPNQLSFCPPNSCTRPHLLSATNPPLLSPPYHTPPPHHVKALTPDHLPRNQP
ncbi:hypothetical protein D8674_020723 [Pyrus ussuriensis x Pyrus communis]|uniref:Uncharacterized protein n=1 Tax=Pyrus ussuriensis x Pyrus communis TaxID=2448454 RepID=A0A5N5HGY0_9ROSA|nr:hypothetical protein D8674_020723 [Pyrus ussuriensis x Pyrus communis]